MPSATLSANLVRIIADWAERRGVSRAAFLERFDVPESMLVDPNARAPVSLMLRLWEEVPELTRDPNFGIHLGEESVATGLPLLRQIFFASRTLREGLDKIVALQRLANDVHRAGVEIVDDGPFVAMRLSTKQTATPTPRHAIEFTFAWMLTAAQKVKPIRPERVAFEHVAPSDLAEHERVFGCPMTFDCDASELVVSRGILETPLTTNDPALGEVLETHARTLLERLPAQDTFAARAKEAMLDDLQAGPSAIAVAKKLRMSERSLHRRHAAEGTTFQVALDELRRDHAKVKLADSRRTIAEVAAELGFSDQSAFHRAFVRWTGCTPGAFRKTHS